MNITIKSIPHDRQRYDTLGDWEFYDGKEDGYLKKGDLIISVSNDAPELPTEDHQFLVSLHELIEVYLCKKRGITQYMVDKFDMETYPSLNLPDELEPGDHPEAPYVKEHRFAMLVEHMMAHELGMVGYGVIR